nr:putative ribonuclease H-like domain-containing protein [Tanacetum cinerariifolium]
MIPGRSIEVFLGRIPNEAAIEKPKRVSNALQDPSWVEAIQEELLQFKIQKVWTLVDCPKGVRPIGTKWVLKNMKDERGIVVRNKARLVAQRNTQEKGIDYDEVFAPVARIEAIRLFLAYASFMGFTVYQMDVKSAFLYGTIDEEVYVMQPPGFHDPEHPAKVYKVEKAMYILHQALRAWYGTLSKYLLKNGFQRGTIDQTLFIRRQREDFILVQVYVDDIIFGSSNPQLCREFEALMHEKFQMSTKDAASQEVKKDVSSLRYITLPNWAHDALLEFSSSKPQDHCSTEVLEGSGNPNPTASTLNPPADQMETLTVETPIPTVSSPVLTSYSTDSQEPSSDARLISKRVANQEETLSLDNILSLTNQFEDILGGTTNSDESNGEEADISNMEIAIMASPTPTLRIHKDHPKSQIIGPVDTPIQTRHKSKEVGEQSFVATIHQKTDPALLQFCLFSCFLSQVEPKKIFDALQDPSWDPEFPVQVYKVERAMYGLHQAPRAWYGTLSKYLLKNGFRRGKIDQTLFIRRKREDFILVQVYVDDIIFGSTNPHLCREFEALMHEKFQMSAMGKLNFFLGLQVLQKED